MKKYIRFQNKKYFIIPAVALAALLAGSTVSAQGLMKGGGGGGFHIMLGGPQQTSSQWEQQISREAGILGISADQMKTYWSEGKGLREIAQEKGISDTDLQAKLKAAREEQHKQWLQTLVSEGKITQAQADARLKFMNEQQAKGPQMKMKMRGQIR